MNTVSIQKGFFLNSFKDNTDVLSPNLHVNRNKSESVGGNFNLFATSSDGQYIVVIEENSMTIMKNLVESNTGNHNISILCEVSLQYVINCCCWTSNSSGVVLGDANGNLHLVSTTGKILFSKRIILAEQTTKFHFVSFDFVNNTINEANNDLSISLNDGRIFLITNLYLDEILLKFETMSKELLINSLQAISISKVSTFIPSDSTIVKSFTFYSRNFLKEDDRKSLQIISLDSLGKIHMSNFAQLVADPSCTNFYDSLESAINSQSISDFDFFASTFLWICYVDGTIVLYNLHNAMGENPVSFSMKLSHPAANIKCIPIPIDKNDTGNETCYLLMLRGPKSVQCLLVFSNIQGDSLALDLGYHMVDNDQDAPIFSSAAIISPLHPILLRVDKSQVSGYSSSSHLLQAIDGILTGFLESTMENVTTSSCIGKMLRLMMKKEQSLAESVEEGDPIKYIIQLISKNMTTFCEPVLDFVSVARTFVHIPYLKYQEITNMLDAIQNTIRIVCGPHTVVSSYHQQRNIEQNEYCIYQVMGLKKILSVAMELFSMYSATKSRVEGQDGERSDILRKALVSILPETRESTLKMVLRLGLLKEAILIIEHFYGGTLPMPVPEMLSTIPDGVVVKDFIRWISVAIIPCLINEDSIDHNSNRVGKQRNLCNLIEHLCKRARCKETAGYSSDGLILIEYSVKISAGICVQSGQIMELLSDAKLLANNLKLQVMIAQTWEEKPTLATIIQFGVEGLLLQQMTSLSNSSVKSDFVSKILPIIIEFNGNQDKIISKWIDITLANCVIYRADELNIETNSEDQSTNESENGQLFPSPHTGNIWRANETLDQSGSCSLEKLLDMVALMNDKSSAASVTLKLFQIPVVESFCFDNEQHESKVRGNKMSVRLCELAESLYGSIELKLKEALYEAVRLLRIKSLAASYNITSFDPRDVKQVRAAVNVIINRIPDKGDMALKDALEFARNWSNSTINIATLLSNGIIKYMTVAYFKSSTQSDLQSMRYVLQLVPVGIFTLVVEDVLTFFLSSIEDECKQLHAIVCSSDESIQIKQILKYLTMGCIHLCSSYLDKSNLESSSTADSSANQILERQSSSWIDVNILQELKDLATMQDVYNKFVDLQTLRTPQLCEQLAMALAEERVKEFRTNSKEKPTKHSTLSDNLKSYDLLNCVNPCSNILNPYIRKACVILKIEPVYFIHCCMNLLFKYDELVLAMQAAKDLGVEQATQSLESNYVPSSVDMHSSSTISSAHSGVGQRKDRNYLLDVAFSLSKLAAKSAMIISKQSQGSSNPSTTGKSSVIPSRFQMATNTVKNDATALNSVNNQTKKTQDILSQIAFPVEAFSLSKDLLQRSIMNCSGHSVCSALDLLNGAQFVLSVYSRIDGISQDHFQFQKGKTFGNASVIGATTNDQLDNRIESTKVSGNIFLKDGILMQPSVVLNPLLNYTVNEIRRRSNNFESTNQKSDNRKADLICLEKDKLERRNLRNNESSSDLTELVEILQRSENHLLAARALLSSWNCSTTKAQAIKGTTLVLSRKVLLYREIDITLSVAFLAAMNYESMVKELKSVVPSIQSNFARLQVVAYVGEELSHLWGQDTLLLVFQGLQTNSKWWNIMSKLGVNIDQKSFQSSDVAVREQCVRSLIPQLLYKSKMDIDLAIEYCRQFDIEPESASILYVELLISQPPFQIKDSSWMTKIRNGSQMIQEKMLLQCLLKALPTIHDLDYEKIRFISSWIVDLLMNEESGYAIEDGDVDTSYEECTEHNQPDSENNMNVANHNSALAMSKEVMKSKAIRKVNKRQTSNLFVAKDSTKLGKSSADFVDNYQMYADLSIYLSGIRFPPTIVNKLRKVSPRVDKIYSIIAESSDLLDRVPFWVLVQNPWSILDVLLEMDSEIALKLSPLCSALKLDRDEFNIRHIKACYNREVNQIESKSNLDVVIPMISALSDPYEQIQVWKWVYSIERGQHDEIAARALNEALKIISKDEVKDQIEVKKDLMNQLTALKFETILKRFNSQLLSSIPFVQSLLISITTKPTELISKVLEIVIEFSWDLQLQGIQSVIFNETWITTLPRYISNYSPTVSAVEFIQQACDLLYEMVENAGVVSSDGEKCESTSQIFENLVTSMLNRMLSDGSGSKNKSSTGDHSDIIKNPTTGLEGSLLISEATLKGYQANSSIAPNTSEYRRRLDVYYGFGIATLIMMCSRTNSLKDKAIYQLVSIVKGLNQRAVRRVSSRSRHRAAQALHFLYSNEGMVTTFPESSLNEEDLIKHREYLFCLCEMQEIRLPCSEESLMHALSLQNNNQLSKETKSFASLKSLVRTWLGDEGHHVEVVELVRDLLLVAKCYDEDIWLLLVGHILRSEQTRCLLQSCTAIIHHPIFNELCFRSIGKEMLLSIMKAQSEAFERCALVLELEAKSFQKETLDKRTMMEWWPLTLDSVLTLNSPTSSSDQSIDVSKKLADVWSEGRPMLRVVCRPHLNYRWESWDDISPEDVLIALQQTTGLILRILPRLSGNQLMDRDVHETVKDHQLKRDTIVKIMQSFIEKESFDGNLQDNNSISRDVIQIVRLSLLECSSAIESKFLN